MLKTGDRVVIAINDPAMIEAESGVKDVTPGLKGRIICSNIKNIFPLGRPAFEVELDRGEHILFQESELDR